MRILRRSVSYATNKTGGQSVTRAFTDTDFRNSESDAVVVHIKAQTSMPMRTLSAVLFTNGSWTALMNDFVYKQYLSRVG